MPIDANDLGRNRISTQCSILKLPDAIVQRLDVLREISAAPGIF